MNHGSHWKKWLIEKAEFRLYSIDLNNPQLEQLLCSYLLPGLRHSANVIIRRISFLYGSSLDALQQAAWVSCSRFTSKRN